MIWQVLAGGDDHPGIIVRDGADLRSVPLSDRLAVGSLVEELELRGERLRYQLRTGQGPAQGWVSISVKGKPLLQKVVDPPTLCKGNLSRSASSDAPLNRMKAVRPQTSRSKSLRSDSYATSMRTGTKRAPGSPRPTTPRVPEVERSPTTALFEHCRSAKSQEQKQFSQSTAKMDPSISVYQVSGARVKVDLSHAATITDAKRVIAVALGTNCSAVRILAPDGCEVQALEWPTVVQTGQTLTVAIMRQSRFRLICYVRPFSRRVHEGANNAFTLLNDNVLRFAPDPAQRAMEVEFDSVHMPGSHASIFYECEPLVKSIIEGDRGLIFLDGQSGAGKSHIARGVEDDPGIVPRAVKLLFEMVNSDCPCDYTVAVSVLAQHQDNLYCISAATRENWHRLRRPEWRDGWMEGCKVEGPRRSGLVMSPCPDDATASRIILEALDLSDWVLAMPTSTGQELCCWHSIIVITVENSKSDSCGKLVVCVLTGAADMRPGRGGGFGNGLTNERFKIAKGMNKSLFAFHEVLNALGKGANVVPYRSHELTMFLQDVLTAPSQIIGIMACSPADHDVDENWKTFKRAHKLRTAWSARVTVKADPRLNVVQ